MLYYVLVLVGEFIDVFVIKLDGIYIDVIFGGGGYFVFILDVLGDNGCFLGFD